jgi:hypothetical protein
MSGDGGHIVRMEELLELSGQAMGRSREEIDYAERHGIKALPRLTVVDDEIAAAIAEHLAPRIRGKTVIDVGGAYGMLGYHLAEVAQRVIVIEANPTWCVSYLTILHARKPANLAYIFGAAQQLVELIEADVAVVATHSDVGGMMALARSFAPVAIDIYGEMITRNPGAFDEWARKERERS